MSKNPVVHFEMPYKDAQRASDFYTKAFGWKMNKMGQEMGGYVVAETAETDDNHMVKTPGTINGGLYNAAMVQKPEDIHTHVIISVDDIEQAIKDVKAAGGTIENEKPMEIAGIGLYVSIRDTEGNPIGMLQPSPKMTK